MPVLPGKRELTKVEEGRLIKTSGPLVEYFVVTSRQLKAFAEAGQRVATTYSQIAETLQGHARIIMKAQERIANFVHDIAEVLTRFERINFVIPIPRQGGLRQNPVPIYIQPDKPYTPINILPTPNRKRFYSLEKVMIKEKGFTVDDEYVSGMTTESQPGKIFKLMINKNLVGKISDKLIGEELNVPEGRYDLIGVVLHDMKRILRSNKLKAEIHRNRAIKEYTVAGITKYIRNPRKKKKAKNKANNN